MSKVVFFRLAYDRIYTLYKDPVPQKRDVRTPEGLLYPAAMALKDGHEVHVVDGHAEYLTPDEVVERVVALKPDVVGCGATTPEFPHESKALQAIRERTGCVTVTGGPHVSAIPVETLRDNPHIDYVVRHEGEYTFQELLRALEAKASPGTVQGLAYREKGEPVLTAPRPAIQNLDELPWPAWELVPMDKYYFADPRAGIKKMASVTTSRGCPFNCIFCFSMHGKKIRYRNPKLVVDEIEELKRRYGTEYIFFHDETLTFDRARTLLMLQDMIDRKLNVEWTCMTRAASLDDEVVAMMAASGCTRASLGIESGSQKILDAAKKHVDQPTLRRAFQLLDKHGIEGRGSLILGLPGETPETIRETIDFIKTLDVKVAAFNIVTPYPGTVLYDMAKSGQGIHLEAGDWKDYRRWGNAVAHTDALSSADLIRWQKRATVEFYTQPKMVRYYLKKWVTLKDPDYYLRPFKNAMRERVAAMLKGDFRLERL